MTCNGVTCTHALSENETGVKTRVQSCQYYNGLVTKRTSQIQKHTFNTKHNDTHTPK